MHRPVDTPAPDPLTGTAARIAAWPRLLAVALGGIAACGFQPLALWPLTIAAVAALIALLARAETRKRAALTGWLFGVGHFTVGNTWIVTAFTYQSEMPAWLGWIAVLALALYLAAYPALATWAAWELASRAAPGRWRGRLAFGVVFAGCWIIAEWLRAWVFTGFAWNPLGIALLGPFDAPGIARIAPWIGTYGLSGVLVLLAALLWFAVLRARTGAMQARRKAAWAGLAGAWAVSLAMMQPARVEPIDAGGVPFTLVQPDLRQEELNDATRYETQFQNIARLTQPRVAEQTRVVLWPESGVPDYLREDYPEYLYRQTTYAADPGLARARIGQVIGRQSLLLTGAVDLVIDKGDAVAARNVVTAIDGHGAILASYAKAHLVPYGEYLALRWLLEPLGASRLVAGALDFWPGPGPRTYDLGRWGRAGVQVCYEIVFSGEVADPRHRPDYIFNPSNDGWFGSWGPPQHLAQARLRAIEEGLPVLRATTTGISAVIDADGVVRAHVARHVAGRIDGRIPYAAEPTLFARTGNMLPFGMAMTFLVLSLVALRRREG